MKNSSLKILFVLCLSIVAANGVVGAQTILVYGEPGEVESVENEKEYSQSAEAGILNVLFDKGCIAFSEMSEADESAIRRLAVKTGSDYIIRWNMVDSGLRGSLAATAENRSIGTVTVNKSDLEDEYKNLSDLYAALGRNLCKSLVGDKW